MIIKEMLETIRALLTPGKGILAADESTGTITKRLAHLNIASTEENRRSYRELLFTTPKLGQFISGVILYDETIRQKTRAGHSFVETLKEQGIIPGIKVDLGAKPMAGFPGEKITEGLDGLRGRLQEYHQLGARFAKWRAVIAIGAGIPTDNCLAANAQALARYAALCQEAGLVPIVEPEVLMDGDHTLEQCETVTQKNLNHVFQALNGQGIILEAMLLKANMVVPGQKCATVADSTQIARATLRCLRRIVPPAVPGIVFLSGGQSEVPATQNLDAINRLGPHPWRLSFSFGRALQDTCLKTWGGNPANVIEAQKALYRRAKANGAAQTGTYSAELETAPVSLRPNPQPL